MSALLRAARSRAAVKNHTPWQVRATALITILGPPAATLVLLPIDCFEYWRTVPFNLADLLVVFFLIAIPEGYVLGAVPALLAAVLYCALLTAHSRFTRPVIRACAAAICGGLASLTWFCECLGASTIYGLVGALVMTAMSVISPQVGAKQLIVQE